MTDDPIERLETRPPPPDEPPPILGSWKRMYAFVLILHAVIILLFWAFGRAVS